MKSPFPILLLALCEPARAIALAGVIPRLKQEIPHARITLVTTKASAELFLDEPAIDETLAFDGAIFNLKALGVLAELSRRAWGLLVDVGPSMVSRMIRSKTRIIINPNDVAGPLKQICQALALKETDVTPRLKLSPERGARAQALLDGGRLTAPILAMAPGAGWLGRRWPTERFAVLATRLMRDDGPFAAHSLVILGNETDRDTAVALAMATPRAQVMELTGKLDLLTACAVLQKTAAFVGNDEIWLRLAAAAGVPTFGLYGPSDEGDAPPGDNMYVIRGPRSLADIRAADPKLKLAVCHMLDLNIDKVYDGIEEVMARLTPPKVEEPEASVVSPEPEAESGPEFGIDSEAEATGEIESDADAEIEVSGDDLSNPDLSNPDLSKTVSPVAEGDGQAAKKAVAGKDVEEPAHAEEF